MIFALVRELADYEKLTAEVDATQEQIAAALFGEQPRVYCDLAEWDGEPAGFALWFLNFSTFRGRYSLFLEDILCGPRFAGGASARRCSSGWRSAASSEGYVRFEWAVLDWNAPAIAFYKSIGAQVLDQWRICRMSGDALSDFAGSARAGR